ncbi:CHAP domain-containing protein [Weissella cibaria]|uniref:COG3942 and LysM peptidoglycan-binding domain-containing protein n=1 Tax=Weissella cibaria TaxID=137591 RepID=UPI00288003A0|nr:CHAP domain-containing protein [Weissella cibaria]MCT0957117.1 CHAP domain-containing protein [Weissella cibaria]
MQNVTSRKKLYKSGKNWVAGTVLAAAALVMQMFHMDATYANEEVAPTQTTSSWRAKTVDQVVSAVQTAGQTYLVQEGDTLSSIASATDLTAEEIAAANKIDDIHFIVVGQTIELTGAPVEVATEPAQVAETVAQVETPAVEVAPVEAPVEAAPVATEEVAPSYNADMSVNGANTYPAGQCTWFVKNALPWVGNYWGNAADWANSATYAGRLVDTNPTVGSVAVMAPGVGGSGGYGHVAVVVAVNGDQITIEEGNYAGLSYNSRTLSKAGMMFVH